jgi:hypothetical protein
MGIGSGLVGHLYLRIQGVHKVGLAVWGAAPGVVPPIPPRVGGRVAWLTVVASGRPVRLLGARWHLVLRGFFCQEAA